MLPVLLQVLSIGRIFISKINLFFFLFFLPPLSSKVQWSSLRWATTYDGVCLMSDRSLWKGRTGIDYHSVYLRAHTISETSQFEIEWAWFRRSGCLTKNRFITFSAFKKETKFWAFYTKHSSRKFCRQSALGHCSQASQKFSSRAQNSASWWLTKK